MKRFGIPFARGSLAAAASATSSGVSASPSPSSYFSFRSSATKRDYYEVLGVSRTATETEIKKAYRKAALKTHPDQGGDKDKFAEVNEAYDCLSKSEKRQVYDAHGHEAVNNMGMGGGGMGGMGGRSPEDIFSEVFGRGGGGFGDMFGGGAQRQQQVRDMDVKLTLTLEEIYKGASKTVRVTRPSLCAKCRGEGTKSGKKSKCGQCHGSGQEVQQHRMGQGMVQQVVTSCRRCKGTGKQVKPEDVCIPCAGEGYTTKSDEVHIQVPAGVPDGVTLCMQGEGGTMPDAIPGNLNIHISQLPHKQFTRRGNDLLIFKDITLSESLLGFEMKLTTLGGNNYVVRSKETETMQHNGVIEIPSEGMKPSSQVGGKLGNIYIICKVNLPQKLDRSQREEVAKIFGPAPRNPDLANTPKAGMIQRKENQQQLEQRKQAEWSGQGDAGQSRQRRGGGGGGGGGQQTECVHQ